MGKFWLCFVPLFVAVDAIGVLPMFVGLTEGLAPSQVRRIVLQSVIVAMAVGLVFLAVGKAVLSLLGIEVTDFMVAGGAVLFVLSVRDLVTMEKVQRYTDPESLGAVPLGVPLIVGPAVLTTTILLTNEYGPLLTASALVINVAFAGAVFRSAEWLNHLLGKTGAKTISKLASLLLAAIAVMIVRKGIEGIVRGPT
jgi:multiple antibiotic resistance protein